jgi:MFS family permease
MRTRLGGYIRAPYQLVRSDHRFRWLWLSNLVSAFGTSVAALALPIAALMLGATPFEMGVVTALASLPSLLFGLPSGVVADRFRRSTIMIVCDLVRAVVALSVPVLYLLDLLTIEAIYAVAFSSALFTLFFDVASTSAVADTVKNERLMDGNIALSLNTYISRATGPASAGFLLTIVSAPLVMLVDAASFLLSALSCNRARLPDHRRLAQQRRGLPGWAADLKAGLRYSLSDPLLRSILGASVLGSLALSFQQPIFLYFLSKDLTLPPQMIGLLIGASGVVSIAGAFLARAASDRFGLGRSVAFGTLLVVLGMAMIAVAAGPPPVAAAIIFAGQILMGTGAPIYVINQLTARQSSVPPELQGRTNATRKFFMFGVTPLGALASGILADRVGSRASLTVATVVMAAALLWTVRSPLWRMQLAQTD